MATIENRGVNDPARSDGSGTARGPRRWRWSSEQYSRLVEQGFLEGRRVQLIEGEIIEMSPQKPPHANSVEKLDDALRVVFGRERDRVRIQLPLDLGRRSQPEPDAAVLLRAALDPDRHPVGAILVVEVADSSLTFERRRKSHVDARAAVPEYWIVNLIDRRLEVYRTPGPDPDRKGRSRYRDLTVIEADGQATPLVDPGAPIVVADLLS